MADWEEISETENLTLTVPVTLGDREGTQLVTVSRRLLGERALLVISAPICADHLVDGQTALGHSATLAIGMLCIEAEMLALRATAFLDVLSTDDVRTMTALIADEAARLAHVIGRGSRQPRTALFHNYAT